MRNRRERRERDVARFGESPPVSVKNLHSKFASELPVVPYGQNASHGQLESICPNRDYRDTGQIRTRAAISLGT